MHAESTSNTISLDVNSLMSMLHVITSCDNDIKTVIIVIPMISKMLLKNDNIAGDVVFISASRSTSHAMYRNVNILSIKLHKVIKKRMLVLLSKVGKR